MDSSTGNKEILMRALAEQLPEDTIYSVCMIKHRHANRLLLVIRGEWGKPNDSRPDGPWLDPGDDALSDVGKEE